MEITRGLRSHLRNTSGSLTAATGHTHETVYGGLRSGGILLEQSTFPGGIHMIPGQVSDTSGRVSAVMQDRSLKTLVRHSPERPQKFLRRISRLSVFSIPSVGLESHDKAEITDSVP